MALSEMKQREKLKFMPAADFFNKFAFYEDARDICEMNAEG